MNLFLASPKYDGRTAIVSKQRVQHIERGVGFVQGTKRALRVASVAVMTT